MTHPDQLPYRPCAGIFLINDQGRVFVAARIDQPSHYWQMPQGGIDEGESPLEAAFREMKEEIGTNNAKLLAETKDWINYDLPAPMIGKIWGGRYRGQSQKWFAFRYLGSDQEIDIETEHPEFSEWQWIDPSELLNYCIEFKQETYRRVLNEFQSHL